MREPPRRSARCASESAAIRPCIAEHSRRGPRIEAGAAGSGGYRGLAPPHSARCKGEFGAAGFGSRGRMFVDRGLRQGHLHTGHCSGHWHWQRRPCCLALTRVAIVMINDGPFQGHPGLAGAQRGADLRPAPRAPGQNERPAPRALERPGRSDARVIRRQGRSRARSPAQPGSAQPACSTLELNAAARTLQQQSCFDSLDDRAAARPC